jgi:hypothetical protein
MKTTQFFKLKKPLVLCENALSHLLYWLWQFCPQAVFYFLVKIRLKISVLKGVLPIFLGGLGVRMDNVRTLLLQSVKEVLSNKRLMSGLVVGLVAFPAWKCHLFFDIKERIEGFYYVNWVFYFNTIRAYLCGIFIATGFFIAAPQKWKFRWWALPVVIFCATEIYEESFYDHWTDFYNSMPLWQEMTLIAVSIVPFFFSVDYLVYRKYHLKDGNLARIIGLIKAPGLTADQKMVHLEKLAEECENFNARV